MNSQCAVDEHEVERCLSMKPQQALDAWLRVLGVYRSCRSVDEHCK